jgi:hypothetical protein
MDDIYYFCRIIKVNCWLDVLMVEQQSVRIVESRGVYTISSTDSALALTKKKRQTGTEFTCRRHCILHHSYRLPRPLPIALYMPPIGLSLAKVRIRPANLVDGDAGLKKLIE